MQLGVEDWKIVSANSCSRHERVFADIVLTTYYMISNPRNRRSEESRTLFKQIKNKERDLLLLDEVHLAPGDMFRKVFAEIKSRCRLGLTAPLLHDSDIIHCIKFLIGPIPYEANWFDLQKEKYLANVECIEIRCPISPMFYEEYRNRVTSYTKCDESLQVKNLSGPYSLS